MVTIHFFFKKVVNYVKWSSYYLWIANSAYSLVATCIISTFNKYLWESLFDCWHNNTINNIALYLLNVNVSFFIETHICCMLLQLI